MKRIAGVAVLAATLGSAHAAAQFDDYSIMGNGAISCSEFARYYRTDAATTEHIFFAWAQGFMSGYNFGSKAADIKRSTLNLKIMDTKEQQAFLRRYCDSYPLGEYMDAHGGAYPNVARRRGAPRQRRPRPAHCHQDWRRGRGARRSVQRQCAE